MRNIVALFLLLGFAAAQTPTTFSFETDAGTLEGTPLWGRLGGLELP